MVGMRLSALRLPHFLRMILSENRTPLFGIMRLPGANLFLRWRRGGGQSSGAEACRENDFVCPRGGVSPLPARRGELKPHRAAKQNRSRDTSCPSSAYDHAPKIDSPPATHDPEKWCPVFGQDHAQKGRRSAERRMPTMSAQHRQTLPLVDALSAAARHYRRRARLPALHRGTRHRLSPRWLSPRTGFPQGAACRCFARSPQTP